jgi:hypothetical protein
LESATASIRFGIYGIGDIKQKAVAFTGPAGKADFGIEGDIVALVWPARFGSAPRAAAYHQ